MTLLALLRLLVIRECVFVKRGRWRRRWRGKWREREMEREREKGRMCRWLLSQGGFFSSSKLELHNKGGLLVNAVCHDSRRKRESQCVIPLFSSWYNQKNILKNSLLWHCSGESRQIRPGGKLGLFLDRKQGERDKETRTPWLLRLGFSVARQHFFFFSKTEL